MSHSKVIVGLSGGVDSATSAALLVKKGFDVIGVFMQNWSDPVDEKGYCPWIEDQLEARRVAEKLKIPFFTFNFEREYKERVLDYFLQEYKLGRTPNPDVMCNRDIKFDLFLNKAKALEADYIATGHYARVKHTKDGAKLFRGIDTNKDQSYFLWALNQAQLLHSLFPIGELTKPEVRKLAHEFGLPNATRKDSQGICFVGPVELYDFLRKYIPSKKGFVRDESGKILGDHAGIFYYTIGQRHGLNLSTLHGVTKSPLYIKEINALRNEIIVSTHDRLYSNEVIAKKISWINHPLSIGAEIDLQVRYRQKPVSGIVAKLHKEEIKVELKEPVWAVTPGQSLVIYKKDELFGGGIIE